MTARARRTVLFIAYFFPPLGGGGVQRTVQFVKYLAPLGWRSEIVTGRAADYWVLDPGLAAQIPPGTVVHRTRALTGHALLGWARSGRAQPAAAGARSRAPGEAPAPVVRSSRSFAWLRRLSGVLLIPDAYAGWFPFALAAARARIDRGGIDALLTTSSPDTAHLVGLVLRERTGVPWVADFRDPWVRRLTFAAPTGLHRRLHEWLERRVLERADRVVVTNEATRDDFLARHPGIPAARFAVIPNGYDPEDLTPLRDFSRERAAAAPPGSAAGSPPGLAAAPGAAAAPRPILLAHTGLLSGKRTLAPLAAALAELFLAHPDLRARLRVRQIGPRESVNDAIVAAAGLGDVVEFAPPVDHARVLREMAAADLLLLLEADEPAGSLITPGKIFEYLASERPILALVPPGPAADLVRAAGGSAVLAPRDAAGVARVLAAWLLEGPPVPPARAGLLAPYARPALAARLAALLDGLVPSE